MDTSVDPLWSAIRHSCWFLSPKYRLPPGCDFLPGSPLVPFLNIGQTVAVFQPNSTSPVEIDMLNNRARGDRNELSRSCSNYGEIPSGPETAFFRRFLIFLETSPFSASLPPAQLSGLWSVSSFVKTLAKNVFSSSAISFPLVSRVMSLTNGISSPGPGGVQSETKTTQG